MTILLGGGEVATHSIVVTLAGVLGIVTHLGGV